MTIPDIIDPRVSYRTATGWIDAFTGDFTPANLFPTDTSVGIAGIPGWEPVFTYAETAVITEAGAVFEDIEVTGGISVQAPNVTIRRCNVINGSIFNTYSGKCFNNLLIEDTTVSCDPPGIGLGLNKAIGDAGYTCRRCAIIDTTEGFRSGGSLASGFEYQNTSIPDFERIRIYDSYCRITPPVPCLIDTDYHGDCWQSFDGGNGGVPITMRNVSLKAIDRDTDDDSGSCASNSCIILDDAQSQDYNFDRILMSGSAIPYRVDGVGRATNILIEQDSWVPGFRPTNIGDWSQITEWSGYTCTIVDGQVGVIVHTIPYGWPGFGPLDPPPDEWP